VDLKFEISRRPSITRCSNDGGELSTSAINDRGSIAQSQANNIPNKAGSIDDDVVCSSEHLLRYTPQLASTKELVETTKSINYTIRESFDGK
jgi:hypothetical protein